MCREAIVDIVSYILTHTPSYTPISLSGHYREVTGMEQSTEALPDEEPKVAPISK